MHRVKGYESVTRTQAHADIGQDFEFERRNEILLSYVDS